MKTEDLIEEIERIRRLSEFEATPRNARDYCSAMPDKEMINRYIEYLIGQSEAKDLQNRSLQLKIEELTEKISLLVEERHKEGERMEEVLSELKEMRKELSKSRSEASGYRKKISRLEEQLKSAKGDRYGKSRRRSKDDDADSGGMAAADRTEAEESCDGSDSACMSDITVSDAGASGNSSATGQTFNVANRPETYKSMGMDGRKVVHKSDRSRVPGNARVIEARNVVVYSLEMTLVAHEYELLHVVEPGKKPVWKYYPSSGHPDRIMRFEGTKATPEFMQALAYEVYMKNVTFGNLHKWVRDMGMTVSRNTLRNWLKKGKRHLDSLIPLLKEAALEKDAIVNCDETWCKVRRYNQYTKKYIWVLVNKTQGVVIFFYDEGSRGRKVLTDFLGEAELKALMSDGYNAYTFLDGELEKTDHLICMAHARVKFSKAAEYGGDPVAKEFEEMISEVYDLEDGYRLRGLSTRDITAERQGEYTGSVVRRIRNRLDEELAKDNEFRSPYMMEALHYLDRFWEGLFLYRKDGAYPIDNNLAERTVRPFTTKRKCSLHFGSDEGVEMSAVYHSIISTLKLSGKSVWNFFGDFFRCEVLGSDTYKEYLPALTR